MVYVTLIYGYALTRDHIEDLFSREEFPDIYREEEHDWQIIDAAYVMLKSYVDPKIKIIIVDYDFSTTYGNFKNKGESTLLIGVEIMRCDAHYCGTAMINDVTDDVKNTLANGIQMSLGIYDNLGTHLYIDAER